MNWTVKKKAKKLTKPALLIGLPGIGNVGKICVDFILQETKAVECASFFSPTFPHSAFVNEHNLVELPTITLHALSRKGKQDLLLLSGDIQPTDEQSCYAFCELLLKQAKMMHVDHIVTLGGIGLKEEPKNPKVFCTGNNRSFVRTFAQDVGAYTTLYGKVGPVMGVSGVLPALTDIPSAILLSETFGHPLYVGIAGAQRMLTMLAKQYDLSLPIKKLQQEIQGLEGEAKKTAKLKALASKKKNVNYIG